MKHMSLRHLSMVAALLGMANFDDRRVVEMSLLAGLVDEALNVFLGQQTIRPRLLDGHRQIQDGIVAPPNFTERASTQTLVESITSRPHLEKLLVSARFPANR